MIKSLNRAIAPAIKQPVLPAFQIYKPQKATGINIMDVPLIDDVARFEIVFESGVFEVQKPGLMDLFQMLVLSGTATKNQDQIVKELDFLGTYYGCENGLFDTTLSLYSTPKLIEKALAIFTDAVINATFPEKELKIAQKRKIAQLKANREKTTFLAKSKLNELYYQTKNLQHTPSEENYLAISSTDLKLHLEKVLKQNITIYKSGNYTISNEVLSYFSGIENQPKNKLSVERLGSKTNTHVFKEGAIQTSLRAKSIGIGRKNEDYPTLQLANTIFGGFFGSLLMKNIREEKGLTYGISSRLIPHENDGDIEISAEIKHDHIELVVEEINKEIQALRSGSFDKQIFDKAKNYLLGNIAKSFDETFALIDKSKLVYSQNLKEDYHQFYFNSIKECTFEEMLAVANKYIHFDDFLFVTSGSELK